MKRKYDPVVLLACAGVLALLMFVSWYQYNRPSEDCMWSVNRDDEYIVGYNYRGINHPFANYLLKHFKKTNHGLKLVSRKYYIHYRQIPKYQHHIQPKWYQHISLAPRSD